MRQPELGKKIIALRKEKGLTQEELVERCNINVRTLQRIESGEANPRSSTIKIIFDALDYDVHKEASYQRHEIWIYIENTIDRIHEQVKKLNQMKNSNNFFYNYFLATGIVWFLCALAIVIFNLHFGVKEIMLTILMPLAFSIFKQFNKGNASQLDDNKEST